ncbi:MAG: hypothetical protein SFT90_06595 [Rickettsiales bacterium]|nr:hypothetical protein [Rickettsiales bacterium]
MNISLKQTENLLIKYDIEGLIEAGAPDDEYSNEANQIHQGLNELTQENHNYEAVLSLISLIWAKNFELDTNNFKQRLPYIKNFVNELINA